MTATTTTAGSGGLGKVLGFFFLMIIALVIFVLMIGGGFGGEGYDLNDSSGYVSVTDQFKESVAQMKAGGVEFEPSAHADEKHPRDAPEARKCFNEYGNYQLFKRGGRYMRTCLYPDGWVAIQILTVAFDGKLQEVTAYIPFVEGGPGWNNFFKWAMKQGWTAYTGNLP